MSSGLSVLSDLPLISLLPTAYCIEGIAYSEISNAVKEEKEVAELICLDYTNRDIANVLFIFEHVVKDHTKKTYPKMNVHSRFELATLVSKHWSDDNA